MLRRTTFTGCLYSKRDVLNCWCDLAFEFLVIWLSLVWSWVVEIYAWLTIWNYFDLRQPQQPQRKSVKIQSCFCSFFVQILISFLLILSLYGSIYAEINSLLDKLNNMFGFCSLFISFCNTWEKNCWKRQKKISQKCTKKLHNNCKTKQILMVSSQLSFLAYFESYSLRIKRQINKKFDKNWAKTTLNFDTFYLRLLRLSEVKIVSNGWSGINFHYSRSHWASVFIKFFKTSGLARSLLYVNSKWLTL